MRKIINLSIYFDLVAGGLVSLPVGASLSSAVASHHVLIQLLRDIQVCHPNQVTAMLQGKKGEEERAGEGGDENSKEGKNGYMGENEKKKWGKSKLKTLVTIKTDNH